MRCIGGDGATQKWNEGAGYQHKINALQKYNAKMKMKNKTNVLESDCKHYK